MKVRLAKRLLGYELGGGRLGKGGTLISKNGGVDPSVEGGISQVWLGTNPIVVDRLIGLEDERVPLTCEYFNLINDNRVNANCVNFNDGL